VRWATTLDRHHRVTVVPAQAPGVHERYGLSQADTDGAAWAITPEGAKHRGAGAIQMTLSVALGTSLPHAIYRLPVMRQIQDQVYRVVSHTRHRLPGDTPYCERHPDACE